MPAAPRAELLGPADPGRAPDNPLVDAMAVFASIHPSRVASGLYEGSLRGRPISLDRARYDELRARVRAEALRVLRRASSRAETASGRYEEQQKVDAHHWIVAPIVKTLGRVADPGPLFHGHVAYARTSLTDARAAIDRGDFVDAAQRIGDGEWAAEQAAKLVLAYVEQIISTTETTVTVLEGVKTASEIVLFLCAVAATGGTAGAGATALGLEGAGATTTLLGVTSSTATWATAVATTTAITGEVGTGIVRAADGDQVDWAEIAVHAAIQIIVAKLSPALGQRLSVWLSSAENLAQAAV